MSENESEEKKNFIEKGIDLIASKLEDDDGDVCDAEDLARQDEEHAAGEAMKQKLAKKELARERARQRKQHKMIMRLIKIILVLVALIAIAVGGFVAWQKIQQRNVTVMATTLYEQIEKVAELTVVKDRYETLLKIELESKVVKPRMLVKVEGVIRVGVDDLGKLEVNMSPDGKSVTIKMPHTRIIENSIENQEVFDDKTYLFARVTTQAAFDAIKNSMREKEEVLIQKGILAEADEQLKAVVSGIATSFGIEDVTFKWLDPVTGQSEAYIDNAPEVNVPAVKSKAPETAHSISSELESLEDIFSNFH